MFLCVVMSLIVKLLNIFCNVVCRKVWLEGAGTTEVQAHITDVSGVVTLFRALLVVAEPVNLAQACVVEVDCFFVVYQCHMGITHSFCSDRTVRRSLGSKRNCRECSKQNNKGTFH